MALDPDYKDFILTIAKVAEARGSTVKDQLLGLMKELGEAIEAYELCTGTHYRKPQAGTVKDVGAELGDVVSSALVCMAYLGLDLDETLQREVSKVKSRFPDVWEMRNGTA
jgi:NTP pyrophosphatase (non-canonical NTP hydrolase)